jgi:hypothetical protein
LLWQDLDSDLKQMRHFVDVMHAATAKKALTKLVANFSRVYINR